MKHLAHVASLVLVGCLAAGVAFSAETKGKPRPAGRKRPPGFVQIEDVAGLPRVLLIGDSISIGYTLGVRKLFEGKANVHRPVTNCGPTTRGLESIDEWLATGGKEKKWDLIHFNWGLHDLKYMGPGGENLATPGAEGSRQQVPPDAYRANLEKLVKRMKESGAKLIWCATTPVPEGAKGRVAGDSAKYNAIAAEVMKANGVATNDLYAFAKPILAEIQRPKNVHFSGEGSAKLAQQVAGAIEKALAD